MKMIQRIKEGYSKMSSIQLEKEMKKSKWGVVVMIGIVLLGISLKFALLPNILWTSYFDSLIWLIMVGLFMFNYYAIREELASREEAHA